MSMTYVFDTDQGEVRVRASSHSSAEKILLSRGYSIRGSRLGLVGETLSPLGGGLMAADGFGGITIDAEGDLGVGIGGGLTIDSEGEIGVGLGGFDVDITDNSPAPEPVQESSSYDSGGSSDFGGGDFSGGGDSGGGD